MILPLGEPGQVQDLVLARKTAQGRDIRHLMAVGFVPLR
jgi:hypothetical protein